MLTRVRKRKIAAEDVERKNTATILYCLPPPLLTLVLHYLPLPNKLVHLTRLHRSFPPLTPAALSFDAISVTPSLQAAWRLSPPLRYLLSNVRGVLYEQWVDGFELTELLWPLSHVGREVRQLRSSSPSASTSTPPLLSFPLAQQMALYIEPPQQPSPKRHASAMVFALDEVGGTAASTHYSRLHSLRVVLADRAGLWREDQLRSALQQPVFAPLRNLPSLRTLKFVNYNTQISLH